MNASDTTSHTSLWNALAQFGIEPQYISLLRRLYADQQETVLTDQESDVFEIKREKKQGGSIIQLAVQHSTSCGLSKMTRHAGEEKTWAYVWVIHRWTASQT